MKLPLVIDLRDSSTHSLVWRGIFREEEKDAHKISGQLDNVFPKSVEKYPPKKQ